MSSDYDLFRSNIAVVATHRATLTSVDVDCGIVFYLDFIVCPAKKYIHFAKIFLNTDNILLEVC